MDSTANSIDPALFQALILLSLITIPFKGLALWKAAHRERKGWFIALLLINTFGIFDIIYYYFLDQDKPTKKSKKQ